jgi:hypothetical protein
MGQKILLRLRPAWAPDTFYDEEDIIHTLLHEAVIPSYTYARLLTLNFLLSSPTMCTDPTIRPFTTSYPA